MTDDAAADGHSHGSQQFQEKMDEGCTRMAVSKEATKWRCHVVRFLHGIGLRTASEVDHGVLKWLCQHENDEQKPDGTSGALETSLSSEEGISAGSML